MQNESKQFGVKVTNSFKKNFNQSILKLSFLYGAILVTILSISGIITYNEFSGRIGKRFNGLQPTITIQLPNGDTISNKPLEDGVRPMLENPLNQPKNRIPSAEDIREDLVASLIFVNGILLLLASIASYWLARITLRPMQEAYERQRRFLGDASHELRTPLTILQIELENELREVRDAAYVKKDKGPHATEHALAHTTRREEIESKLEEVQRMCKLVADLLTLSRLDDDTIQKQKKPSHIHISEFAEHIKHTTERLTSLAKSHSVTLSFKDETNQLNRFVSIDKDLLSHAITNLIQNAIFYNTKDGTVDVRLISQGKKIKLIISDTGVGISEHDLQHIFDRFYRADKSRTSSNVKHSGSGLGLSIAKSALIHMGGNLYLTSEVNKGTTATVEFFTFNS